MHKTPVFRIFSCFSLFTYLSMWTDRALGAISIFEYGQLSDTGEGDFSLDSILIVLCALWLIYVINFNNVKTGR